MALDRYAERVVAGEVLAGTYHRLACARHLRDRRREGTSGFPYRFEGALADRFVRFAEKLKHYKGRQWAGRAVELSESQVFRLGSLAGWVHCETGWRRFRKAYNELPRKQGKALALDTPVPTPHGWTRHGDLRVGDYVCGPDGLPKRVQWVSAPMFGPCYRLKVSTGDSVVAHAAHEWVTRRTWYTGKPRGLRGPLPPVETQIIAKTLRCGSRGDYVHRIDVAAPLHLPPRVLPIPPYTLGAWLGDGTSDSGSITVGDVDIIRKIEAEGITCRPVSAKGAATLYRLDGAQGSQRSLTSRLRRLGVLGSKHIPALYLRASHEQRLELLRGLVDTDGYLGAMGVYEIVSVSARLADDIRELVQTLGMKTTVTADRAQLRGRDCGPRYRVHFSSGSLCVAGLDRKRSTWVSSVRPRSRARTIIACDPCDQVPVNCIEVEGGIYLVGRDFLQTHNSLEGGIVADYYTFFDGEAGAEGFCTATKRDQAKIVFEAAKMLVERNPSLKRRIAVAAWNLSQTATASKLEPLSADHDSMDGLNPHVVIIDEFHAHKDRGIIDVMETAMGARVQPVMFEITTAGDDEMSPCGDEHHYACDILNQVITDETFFAFIAHADDGDDPFDETTWRKANPHFGGSVNPDDMRALATKARHMPAALAEFQQKRLNVWINASQPWLSLDRWKAGQTAWTADDVRGRPCYVAADLASKVDLAAVAALYPPVPDDDRWRLLVTCFTPEDGVEARADLYRAPLRRWIQAGHIRTNPGNRIDPAAIKRHILDLAHLSDVQMVGFDPWNIGALAHELEEALGAARVVEIPQNMTQLSEPSKEFEAEVGAARVDAGGNPVMTWMVSHAVVDRDSNDNIKPTKNPKKMRGRIDGVIAAIMAMKLARLVDHADEAASRDFAERGLFV